MRIAALALAIACLPVPAFAEPQSMAGHWARSDGAAKVRIAPCGRAMCATNTWVADTTGTEKVGDVLVMNVSQKSEGLLSGTAYDRRRKMSFGITISVAPEKLTSKGCVLGGLLCKAAGWSRLN